MANPSTINTRTNELILAHCTIGLKQTERYIIRNHFETEKGIAIQGLLPTGDVTIVKCGGECQYVPHAGAYPHEYSGGLFPEKPARQSSYYDSWEL